MSPEKLAHMANQIAAFYAHQPIDEAAANIADHLHKFWDPRMRKAIVDWAEKDGAALTDPARKAVALLKAAA